MKRINGVEPGEDFRQIAVGRQERNAREMACERRDFGKQHRCRAPLSTGRRKGTEKFSHQSCRRR